MFVSTAYAADNFDIVGKAVSAAKDLGDLPSGATWALLCLILLYYTWNRDQYNRKVDKEWQVIRLKDAEADAAMAQAVGKMADETSKLRTIIDERIPRIGGK
jgi:hypothetical protein